MAADSEGISMRRFLLVSALALAATGLSFAEEAGALSGSMEVSAPAWSPLAAAPGAPIEVIDSTDIEESGASNLGELLEGRKGVVINRNGAGPGVALPSIRGSSSSQVLVIVDGVRVNDGRQGGADLSLIPVDSIERIEILTTGASAIYGPDALGGAIVITTKRAKANHLSTEIANVTYPGAIAQGGPSAAFDTQRLSIDGGLSFSSATVGLAASAERSLSAYPYGGDELRKNSAYMAANGKLDMDAPLAGGKLGASVSGRYRDAKIAGSLSYPVKAEEGDDAVSGKLSWASDALAGGLFSLDVSAHGSWARLDYADSENSYNDGRYDMATAGLDLRTSYFATEALEIGAGLTGLYEETQSTVFDAGAEGQPRRLSLGAYLEPKYLAGDSLVLAPVLRYDWSDDYSAGLSVMATARWQATEWLELRASGGSSYRAPTFNELYWPYTDYGSWGSYEGNPSLKPETAWSGDLGVKLELGDFSLSCSGFARYVDNLIVTSSDFNASPINVDKAFVPGASAGLAYALGAFKLEADYEYLYPLDLSDAACLAEATRIGSFSVHKANAHLSYRSSALCASLGLRYASEHSSSSDAIPGVFLADMGASYKVVKRVTVGFNIDNLFDASYEVIADYPMPGRSVTTKVKVEL